MTCDNKVDLTAVRNTIYWLIQLICPFVFYLLSVPGCCEFDGNLEFSPCEMDESLYLVCSALLISIVVWLLNPFGKLHNLLSYLLRTDSGHANLSEGVRSFDEMPGPKGLPYFGDVINYLKNSEFKPQMTALQNSFEKYGPIFKRTIMGRTFVCVQDPRNVEIVFKADGRYPVRPKNTVKVQEMYRKSRNLPQGVVTL